MVDDNREMDRRSMLKKSILGGVVFASWFLLANLYAQDYGIPWYTIDGGGGVSTSTDYTLRGTIGQPDTGWLTSVFLTLRGGYRRPLARTEQFIRGDANGDGVFNGIADGTTILGYQFLNLRPPPCLEAADADGNGVLNGLVDALYVLNFNFLPGQPPPPSPYPQCGVDPDPGTSLGCDANPGCR